MASPAVGRQLKKSPLYRRHYDLLEHQHPQNHNKAQSNTYEKLGTFSIRKIVSTGILELPGNFQYTI